LDGIQFAGNGGPNGSSVIPESVPKDAATHWSLRIGAAHVNESGNAPHVGGGNGSMKIILMTALAVIVVVIGIHLVVGLVSGRLREKDWREVLLDLFTPWW
jgi:hypothetical protein